MSILLEKSIESLSAVVNLSTGLSHPLDDSRAKELFIELVSRKETIEHGEVLELAKKSGWPDRHATNLANLAVRIGNGERVQISAPRNWGEFIIEKILVDIGKSET